MRVIAGTLKGREIKTPKGHRTHPMSEKVRGALFNSLGEVSDLSVLDAYAGSGALGFEAVSRGASFVQFVEKDFNASSIVDENISSLGVSKQAKSTRANVASWSKNYDEKFDLVICDPPYDMLNTDVISGLTKHLKDNGLMVLSFAGREPVPTVNGVVVVDSRIYGDAALAFYRLGSTIDRSVK